MPIYAFACPNSLCEREWEAYVPSSSSPNPPCECGSTPERVWKASFSKGADTFPYVTNHITGRPLEIRSASHLKEVERRYGVRLRDDAAWTEKTIGLDERGRKQYREGSGMGLKGVWI